MTNISKKMMSIGMTIILLLSVFIPVAHVENASAPIGSNSLLLQGEQKDGFTTVQRIPKIKQLFVPQIIPSMVEWMRDVRQGDFYLSVVIILTFFVVLLKMKLLRPLKYTSNYL
ncbi:hypothetical protein BVG16_02030 [Paenibacillus selenitireducens]|uniref:Uncharacterized protein n=1 Tax=Paenibacillus selenitireducens TaxID=1324314 RepID=A0A1T2XMV2_9BACL|nr:hypothetical protein [Paenibacillus selenitireducens]OPA81135.1 hypothetical protein BVG16_02030 [Paenibacillus selenitireducens]